MRKQRQHDVLMEAADLGLLYYGQVKPLLEFLEQRERRQRIHGWHGVTILWYAFGLLVIAACTLFSTLALEKWGTTALLNLSLMYLLVSFLAAIWFDNRQYELPTTIFATLFVCLFPLMVFATQHVMGMWPDLAAQPVIHTYHHWFDKRWLSLELSTLFVALVLLRRFKSSFLVFPLGLILLYICIDLLPAFLLGKEILGFNEEAWLLSKQILIGFGLVSLSIGFVVDLYVRTRREYAFWIYLLGLIIFSLALLLFDHSAMLMKFLYLSIFAGLIFVSATLQRRTFMVFGSVGVMFILTDIAWSMFKASFAFIGMLSFFALILFSVAIWWSRNEHRISALLRSLLPETMQNNLMWRH